MTNEDDEIYLSPTVLQVIEQFSAAMHTDSEIESQAIDRLTRLLKKGKVPKPEEISSALFGTNLGGKK